MDNFTIDIIVPVWNRPVETRDCLVTLMDQSPGARFILVDNGSDRETERILQEFAELLDNRALLLRNDVNQGYVRAVNRGLARAEAPLAAVVRNTSQVSPGWLEPLLRCVAECPQAGIVVPTIVEAADRKGAAGGKADHSRRETSCGSLAAMVIRKALYDAAGGLDEELDGGMWCLKDFSQRAREHGFLTLAVPASLVAAREEPQLGSAERRSETLRLSAERYRERWGEGRAFCIVFPAGVSRPVWEEKKGALLAGARCGHIFTVLAESHLYRELCQTGEDHLHDGIVLRRIPRLFKERWVARTLEGLREGRGDTTAVCGVDGIPFPGGEPAISFADLARIVDPR